MDLKELSLARLTDRELEKLKEAEAFINSQPDHEHARKEGKDIVLLAFTKSKET